jgi:RimJ/RimL family protein N-acetyltransferase
VTPFIPARVDTQRLVLRTWRSEDRQAFAVINADPAVTEHVSPMPLSRAASDALADRIEASWMHRGYGLYAVEDRDSGQFLGFCGLSHHRPCPKRSRWGGVWRVRPGVVALRPRPPWCVVISASTRCAWAG